MSARMKEMLDIPENLVTTLRTKFLAEAEAHPAEYDQQDMDSIRTKEWTLRRFLVGHKSNVDEALKALITTMKWRKTMTVSTLEESQFPRELYRIGGVFTYAKDRNDSSMLIFRVRVNKRFKEWMDTIKKLILYQVEREDHRAENKEITGVTVVFDCIEAGVSNVDIDLLSFIVTIMRDHYPCLLSCVLVVELPWILQWVFKLVQSWLPEEQRKLIHLVNKKEEMTQFVAPEQLPDYMGGTNATPYRTEPKTATTVAELGEKLGIKKNNIEKFLKYLEPHMQ